MPNQFPLREPEFLGAAVTVALHAMYVTAIPCVVQTEAMCQIVGEAYLVEEDLLLNQCCPKRIIKRMKDHAQDSWKILWNQDDMAGLSYA